MRAFIVYNDLLGNLVKQFIEQRRLRNTVRIHVTVCYRYMDGVRLHTLGKPDYAMSTFNKVNGVLENKFLNCRPLLTNKTCDYKVPPL